MGRRGNKRIIAKASEPLQFVYVPRATASGTTYKEKAVPLPPSSLLPTAQMTGQGPTDPSLIHGPAASGAMPASTAHDEGMDFTIPDIQDRPYNGKAS